MSQSFFSVFWDIQKNAINDLPFFYKPIIVFFIPVSLVLFFIIVNEFIMEDKKRQQLEIWIENIGK